MVKIHLHGMHSVHEKDKNIRIFMCGMYKFSVL